MARSKKNKSRKSTQSAGPPQTAGASQANTPEKSPDELLADLKEKYGRFVDESLIILLFQEQSYEDADAALAAIGENTLFDEASGFDPSGLHGGIAADDDAQQTSSGSSYHTTIEDPSQVASTSGHGSGSTSGSQYAPLSIGDGSSAAGIPDDWPDIGGSSSDLPTDGLSNITYLRDAFPMVKESDINKALKESGDNVDKASDILLNLEHLIETNQRPKGVDGFAVDDDDAYAWSSKKKRDKRKDKSATNGGLREQRLIVSYKPTHPHGTDGTYEFDDGSTPAPKRGSSKPFHDTTAYERRGASQKTYDKIVDSQSKDAHTVDLHNVPVNDGVRIALQRTHYWWAHLGEDRVRKARDQPLRLVTGQGLHSPEGYSRMYTRVEKALKAEGWKFVDGFGYYDITGKIINERAS